MDIQDTEIPDVAISIISEMRKLPSSFIVKALKGSLTINDVNSFDEYDMLYKLRHDYAHWLICQFRGIQFGEKKIFKFEEFKKLIHDPNWNYIKQQSPDIIHINGNHVTITELTITSSRLAKKEKITKYSLLIDVLKKNGFVVDFEVIIISNMISGPANDLLVTEHKLDKEVVSQINEIIKRINHVIHQIDSTPIGQEWNIRRHGEIFHDIDLKISDNDILNYASGCKNFPFYSMDHLKSILNVNSEDGELTDHDRDFLEHTVEVAESYTPSLQKNQIFSEAYHSLLNYHNKYSNSKELRSFLPLPFMMDLEIDSASRKTEFDEEEFNKIRWLLHDTDDIFLSKVGDMKESRGRISLTLTERSNIALQGPGRKHFIKQKSQPHMDRQEKNKKYWINLDNSSVQRGIESLSFELSNLSRVDVNDPSNFEGLGINYVKCCQSVFREISLNAMRKDRRHDYIFRPTGVKGVYIVIFPGSKLRTGENLSTIWFKLITTPNHTPIDLISNHWAFKKWNRDKEILHTNWISIDANRLDHYIRCYDRILMSYLSYMHSGPSHLIDNIKNDKSNTLGIIIMIYMEDKRTTSKMLQDIRYLVMGSLSKFRWWGDLLDKYKEPLRTPLQAYLLRQALNYAIDINNNLTIHISNFHFGKVHQDGDIISDKLAGVNSSLPRVLTSGDKIPFQQLLCEMYFTMLFNKNQDDPTHATFQILDKMLEGEKSLNEVKESTKLHLGGYGDLKEIDLLISSNHKNQFSSRALMIGSKLQSIDQNNVSPAGLAHRKAAQNPLLNKPLSEFATYKSSAVFENAKLNNDILTKKTERKSVNKDTLEEKYREGGDDDEDPASHVIIRQNPRRRCIEGIIDLLQTKGFLRSFDVIKSTINQEMFFQIFKKNQIGGPREILILPIEKRITINILESFSRLICKDDIREMLTHGDVKLSMMRDMIRDVKRTDDKKRIILNFNLDKSRWGPSFMPIQFMYLFKPFAQHYPSLFRFLMLTLIVHTNKKCLIPEKLLQAWMKDSHNKLKHHNPDGSDSLLQKLKENFLKTKDLFFENESNMGQGILHYTSSYLHICAISYRDYIYKRLCARKNVDTGSWKDIVSSDDSYTALALPLDKVNKINMRIDLFMRAQEVTERLFNIWTSKSKSSISFLLSEFNSMFGSNMTLFPTLFKFALASVMPFNTDSFFRMVKESYNVTRQIVENGGSLELYMIAHKLNKKYCEDIYHTNIGGVNDFKNFGLRREFVPYQLGVYPINDPGIMLLLGPESHNYNIMENQAILSKDEENLLISTHTLIPVTNPELYAEMNNFDNIFTGLLRIEACLAPIRKLQRIKRQIDMNWAEMNEIIDKDLLITLREPKTMQEMKLHTYLKLFSYGSSEALRDTASSIYYARVAASVTAKAFQIPHHDNFSAKYGIGDDGEKKLIGFTYRQCLEYLIERKNDFVDLKQFYPHLREYRDLLGLSGSMLEYQRRNIYETQNIRSLQLSEVTMRIKNPIKDLLDSFWIKNEEDKPTSYFRDWVSLKELVPIIQDSLSQTLEQLSGDRVMKIKILLLILMRIMGYSSRPMKAVIYGSSSRTYDATYLTLIQQNLYHNYTCDTVIINETVDSNPRIYDKLYYTFNHFLLKLMMDGKTESYDDIDLSVVNSYIRDNFISKSSKKKIMIMLMYLGYLEDIKKWTEETKTIIHYWVKRQSRTQDGKYQGNFNVITQCGNNKLRLERVNTSYKITLSTTSSPILNYELLKSAGELVQMSVDEIVNKLPKGSFLILTDRIHSTNINTGKRIYLDNIDDINYHTDYVTVEKDREVSFLTLYDTDGYQIIKTPIGLMATDYIPFENEFSDFKVNGISISKLALYKFFSVNFSYDSLPTRLMIDILDDLKVDRPKIADISKQRLGSLVQDWDVKAFGDILGDEEEYVDELYDQFIEDIKNEPTDLDFEKIFESDPYDIFLDPNLDIGLTGMLPLKVSKFQPVRILDRILNAKYQLIARSCTDITLLSKYVITKIYKATNNNVDIARSLIYMYDKMYSSTDTPSPSGVTIIIEPKFVEKFLRQYDNDDDIIID